MKTSGGATIGERLSQCSEGMTEAALLLVVIVTPTFFNIHSSRVFEPDKVALLRAIALIICVSWLMTRLLGSGLQVRDISAWRWPLVKPIGTLVLAYLVATLFSLAPLESTLGSYHRQHGAVTAASLVVVCLAIAGQMRSRRQVDRLIRLIAITSLPVALYSLLQHGGWDPLTWSAGVQSRPPSTLGNPIFLAAYLALGLQTALGIVIAIRQSPCSDASSRSVRNTELVGYAAIIVTDLVAILLAGSRGPLLGLGAGLFFMALLWAIQRRRVEWAIATLAVAAAGLAGFLALNLAGGPFVGLRDSPGTARLGRSLETSTGSQRVRVLLWSGAIRLILPHPPIEYPDGTVDPVHAARPFLGHGPETFGLLFGRVYPPNLADYERRTALADRAHNQALEALASSGLFGALAELGLLVCLLRLGLAQLGLVCQKTQSRLFACLFGGGFVGAMLAGLWGGLAYIFPAVPLGLVTGLVLFLGLFVIRLRVRRLPPFQIQTIAPQTEPPDQWRAGVLIIVLSAILAHVIETTVGIRIVATSLISWISCGLLIALGRSSGPTQFSPMPREDDRPPGGSGILWRRCALIGGAVTSMLVVTLAYDFVAYERGRWWQSISGVAEAAGTTRDVTAVVGLMAVTCLIAGMLSTVGEWRDELKRWGLQPRWNAKLLLGPLGAGAVVAGCWLAAIARIDAVDSAAEGGLSAVSEVASGIGWLLTDYLIEMFLLLTALAAVVSLRYRAGTGGPGRHRGQAKLLFTASLVSVIALAIGVTAAFCPVRADMMHDIGWRLELRGQYGESVRLYERACALALYEDHYHLALARVLVSAARTATNPDERDVALDRAIQALARARALNPLNSEIHLGLARASALRAEHAEEPALQRALGLQATRHYQDATNLSPNSIGMWNEWARLEWQLLGEPERARLMLERSLALDPTFGQTIQLLRELERWRVERSGSGTTAGRTQPTGRGKPQP